MASYLVEVADHVDPQQAVTKLNRFAQQLAEGEALFVPLPAGFPMEAVPGLAFQIRYWMEQVLNPGPPPEQGEVPEPTEPVAV